MKEFYEIMQWNKVVFAIKIQFVLIFWYLSDIQIVFLFTTQWDIATDTLQKLSLNHHHHHPAKLISRNLIWTWWRKIQQTQIMPEIGWINAENSQK